MTTAAPTASQPRGLSGAASPSTSWYRDHDGGGFERVLREVERELAKAAPVAPGQRDRGPEDAREDEVRRRHDEQADDEGDLVEGERVGVAADREVDDGHLGQGEAQHHQDQDQPGMARDSRAGTGARSPAER